MGKWAARLAEKTTASSHGGTDKTAKRGLVSVLAVSTKGGTCEMPSAPVLASNPAEKLTAVELAAMAWTDVGIARFFDRRSRLLRWGWTAPEAEALADRLARRDRERDDRVTCSDCQHYRPGRCDNHRQAALTAASIGKDWATLLQRCDGFSERAP